MEAPNFALTCAERRVLNTKTDANNGREPYRLMVMVKPNEWHTQSSSDMSVVHITKLEIEGLTCTCPGFKNHGYCWHISAVKQHFRTDQIEAVWRVLVREQEAREADARAKAEAEKVLARRHQPLTSQYQAAAPSVDLDKVREMVRIRLLNANDQAMRSRSAGWIRAWEAAEIEARVLRDVLEMLGGR